MLKLLKDNIKENKSQKLSNLEKLPSFKGQEIIKFIAKNLPQKPGIYQMEDEYGKILYIGKAKNLAKRVLNYTSLNNLTRRLQRMVSQTKAVNFSVTNTEVEALLLECTLIKKYKPKFNILLKDDKSFPFIFISEHKFPRIERHRGAKNKPGKYYGPFASSLAVNTAIKTLQRIFLVRSCTDKQVEAGDRTCFNYYLRGFRSQIRYISWCIYTRVIFIRFISSFCYGIYY